MEVGEGVMTCGAGKLFVSSVQGQYSSALPSPAFAVRIVGSLAAAAAVNLCAVMSLEYLNGVPGVNLLLMFTASLMFVCCSVFLFLFFFILIVF